MNPEEIIVNRLKTRLVENLPIRKKSDDSYFDKLDEIIKEDKEILKVIYSMSEFPTIASGGFATALTEMELSPTISLIGGLRGSRKLDLSNYRDIIKGNTFTFLDDSYYAGRTLRKIFNEVIRLGGRIGQVIVVYNDSNDPFVIGLINREDLLES